MSGFTSVDSCVYLHIIWKCLNFDVKNSRYLCTYTSFVYTTCVHPYLDKPREKTCDIDIFSMMQKLFPKDFDSLMISLYVQNCKFCYPSISVKKCILNNKQIYFFCYLLKLLFFHLPALWGVKSPTPTICCMRCRTITCESRTIDVVLWTILAIGTSL